MREIEKQINKSCSFLERLNNTAKSYHSTMKQVERVYKRYLNRIAFIVFDEQKTDWNTFSDSEKTTVENCSYLVGLLYQMCKVQIVKKSGDDNSPNMICQEEVSRLQNDAAALLDRLNVNIQPT